MQLDENATLVSDLREAAAAGDVETVEHQAHSIKSNSANIGAMVLNGLCAEVEQKANRGSTEGVPDLVDRIEAEWERVRAALEGELRKEGHGTA